VALQESSDVSTLNSELGSASSYIDELVERQNAVVLYLIAEGFNPPEDLIEL